MGDPFQGFKEFFQESAQKLMVFFKKKQFVLFFFLFKFSFFNLGGSSYCQR